MSGAGSSAAAPIYKTWAREYQKASGIALNYDPAGSSAGIKKIAAAEVDFGASDVAPSSAELNQLGLVLFPVAITGIAPVLNLPKIGEGKLKLSADVLARIFLGDITHWNAREIAALNGELPLPDLPIKVVVRSDGSGTTYNFADFLAKVSPQWSTRFGVKTSYTWPDTHIAVKGSSGVVKAIKDTPGSIGYVDYGYVAENGLNYAQVQNPNGTFVKPTTEAFRSALLASEWASKGAFGTTLTQMPGKSSWPITMGTYVLVPKVTDKPEATQRALKFFAWSFTHGDALVQESSFVRLPDRVQALAYRAISSVRDKSGAAIGAGALSM